jgi:hypothetical protein
MSTRNSTAADKLIMFTWFPFKFGCCGEVQDVVVLDEWVFENNGRFTKNAHLYPGKIPSSMTAVLRTK